LADLVVLTDARCLSEEWTAQEWASEWQTPEWPAETTEAKTAEAEAAETETAEAEATETAETSAAESSAADESLVHFLVNDHDFTEQGNHGANEQLTLDRHQVCVLVEAEHADEARVALQVGDSEAVVDELLGVVEDEVDLLVGAHDRVVKVGGVVEAARVQPELGELGLDALDGVVAKAEDVHLLAVLAEGAHVVHNGALNDSLDSAAAEKLLVVLVNAL